MHTPISDRQKRNLWHHLRWWSCAFLDFAHRVLESRIGRYMFCKHSSFLHFTCQRCVFVVDGAVLSFQVWRAGESTIHNYSVMPRDVTSASSASWVLPQLLAYKSCETGPTLQSGRTPGWNSHYVAGKEPQRSRLGSLRFFSCNVMAAPSSRITQKRRRFSSQPAIYPCELFSWTWRMSQS